MEADVQPLRHRTLTELGERDCRWPVEGQGASTLFCAGAVTTGRPYCGEHCAHAGAGYVFARLGQRAGFNGRY